MTAQPFAYLRDSRAAGQLREISGLSTSAMAYLLLRSVPELRDRRSLDSSTASQGCPHCTFVFPSESEANDFCGDLLALGLDARHVLAIPASDSRPYGEIRGDRVALRKRLAALATLATGGGINSEHSITVPRIIAISAKSLSQKCIAPEPLRARSHSLSVGDEIDRDALCESLAEAGFQRQGLVDDLGHFAVRGAVIDFFPAGMDFPVRLELFGDEIESIRLFDLEDQRTIRPLERVSFHPVHEAVPTGDKDVRGAIYRAADDCAVPSKQTKAVFERIQSEGEFLGIEALVPAFHSELVPVFDYWKGEERHLFVVEPERCLDRLDEAFADATQRYQQQKDQHRLAFPPADHYLTGQQVANHWASFTGRTHLRQLRIEDSRFQEEVRQQVSCEPNLSLRTQMERERTTKSETPLSPLLALLTHNQTSKVHTWIACASVNRMARLRALLDEHGHPPLLPEVTALHDPDLETSSPYLLRANISEGFSLPNSKFCLLTDDEIFGARRSSNARQKRAARRAREALRGGVADFSQLQVGDYLVHVIHGVGQYKGLEKLPIQGTPVDFLHLQYTGGTLYLPVVRIGEVQRYVGAQGISPRLDKLGGQSFAKSRKGVAKKVQVLAEELLQLYAQRAALPGFAFPPTDRMYADFEASFAFEETPDQATAIEEIQKDMSEARPMDRLICGDVGYGKTEVALRAIMRAVMGGKQVAFLAPTTVLVEQHFQSMQTRFRDWPLRCARLSRFQKRKEQLEVLAELRTGQIDAVVGTHRLLSKDVQFKDLGLLVIDEEQRFGVAHKERFKKMRSSIEVLTLTATPIPRTLHLAMSGLRDLSIIATPPADRLAIRTFVARTDLALIAEGIRKELARNGQVFFVSPRIDTPVGGGDRSLEEWHQQLKELVPKARFAVAHGQMDPDKLEATMVGFVEGKFDVLISTTIVEAGLDIPRANTMFVDRADRFGLSQLYQLRGRIGRSMERAYCYLLVPAPEKLSDDARKRLETLQRHTELGAGFSIASQDLEIRGAGELLGAKQSGSIAAIGFDAYTRMLEEAVAELQGTPIQGDTDPELNVNIPGFIPDDYVPETAQRLSLYKRLASALDEDEIQEILQEMNDRYGPIPGEVGVLGELMVLKGLARRLRATALELGPQRMVLSLPEHTPLDPQKVLELVKKSGSLYALRPDMRLERKFNKPETEAPVATARKSLEELSLCTSG